MVAAFKKTVFITGINGFTGIYLEKHLIEKGFEVYGTTLNQTDNPNHFPCDILSEVDLFNILSVVTSTNKFLYLHSFTIVLIVECP